MPPSNHSQVKVISWALPKNELGNPSISKIISRQTEVVFLNSVAIAAGTNVASPIIMNRSSKICIYGQVDANHPFYIFTNGVLDTKLNLLQEVFPETIDGEYHFYIKLEDTPLNLYIGTGNQALTFTLKYTLIE